MKYPEILLQAVRDLQIYCFDCDCDRNRTEFLQDAIHHKANFSILPIDQEDIEYLLNIFILKSIIICPAMLVYQQKG